MAEHTPDPKFKVGDRVKISAAGKRAGMQWRRHGVTRIGTVVRVWGSGAPDIKWDGNSSVNASYPADWLELAKATGETR